jgi:hypothetical protein
MSQQEIRLILERKTVIVDICGKYWEEPGHRASEKQRKRVLSNVADFGAPYLHCDPLLSMTTLFISLLSILLGWQGHSPHSSIRHRGKRLTQPEGWFCEIERPKRVL